VQEKLVAKDIKNYIINGTLQDMDNFPLENIKVYLDNEETFALTDKNGEFEFSDVLAGSHTLYYLVDFTTLEELEALNLGLDGDSETIYQVDVIYNINVSQGIIVYETGRVFELNSDNSLKTVKLVYANLKTGKKYTAYTDGEGIFGLDLPRGEYEVTLSKGGFHKLKTRVNIGKAAPLPTRRR